MADEGGWKGFWRTTTWRATLFGGVFALLATVLGVTLPKVLGDSGDASHLHDYYSTDGSIPPLSPGCIDGIFTLCLGDHLDEAKALFGQETTKFGQPGDVGWRWDVAGSIIVVHVDDVGQVTGLSASVRDTSADFRLNVPGPLTLGTATMGDVISLRGEPVRKDAEHVEGGSTYAYVYCTGVEGSTSLSFFLFVPPDATDPGGFNNKLASTKVTAFASRYESCL